MHIFMTFSSVTGQTGLLLICMLTGTGFASAQEDHHTDKQHQVHNQQSHQHGMEHSGGHGAINKQSQHFPTSAYTEKKAPREIQRPALPEMQGNAAKGKTLATGRKGRCLTCHILDTDGKQAGNVGPNLSQYASLGRSTAYTFQQIWDARAHNPNTVMPPFGSNEVLNRHETMHIVAYLETLNTPLAEPKRPQPASPNYYVAGEDLTQADEYIEQGEKLFKTAGNNGKSCAACHHDNLKGVAASYPKFDNTLGKVVNVEQRINQCRQTQMHSKPYHLGSRESNMLTSYVKYLSRNMPIKLADDEQTTAALQKGRNSFYQKTGILNFSCADCHDQSAGKWLRGQALNSIRPKGEHSYTAATWPRHFIALHELGLISLQQRIRHCQIVTQTYPLKLGAEEYINMELYITSLANGSPMQAPTMSRLRGEDQE